MSKILGQIEHVIVVMLENRSFDNMCGWLYGGDRGTPKAFLPEAPSQKPRWGNLGFAIN